MNMTKRNKKEEQKKLYVRIACIALAVVMVVTSLLAVIPSLFQSSIDPEMQALIDAGYLYVGEDGTIYATEAYIDLLTQSAEDHEDHDHE